MDSDKQPVGEKYRYDLNTAKRDLMNISDKIEADGATGLAIKISRIAGMIEAAQHSVHARRMVKGE